MAVVVEKAAVAEKTEAKEEAKPESLYIIVDASEESRNGDAAPDRLGTCVSVAERLTKQRLARHPESLVGVLDSSCPAPLLVTLTREAGVVGQRLGRLGSAGTAALLRSVRVALLGLRHKARRFPAHRLSVVAIVASPVTESADDCRALATALRQDDVALTAVLLIQDAATLDKLAALGARVVHVQTGQTALEALTKAAVLEPVSLDLDAPEEDDELTVAALKKSLVASAKANSAASLAASKSSSSSLASTTKTTSSLASSTSGSSATTTAATSSDEDSDSDSDESDSN